MRKTLALLLSAATLFAVSCNKVNDTPTYLSEPFALDGKTYATLQEAVDAASGITVQGAECVISLLSCAEGDGAVISDFPGEALLIDLKGYDYAVKDGGSIRISGSCVDIQSEGGSIIGRGSSPAISLDYSLVNLSKQLRIGAENAISACDESEIYTDGFSGTIEGNISLDGSFFCVLSSDCRISVPLLSVTGEYAAFSAETETVPSSSIVDIQKVASDSGYPVMSFKPGVIRVQDGDVHIHNFTEEYIPGSCIGTGRTQFECKDCGYITYNFDDKMGTCCPEDLIHHEAKDAEDFEYGYVESWECPVCGRFYADAKAQNELTVSPLLFPRSILLGEEILRGCEDLFDWDKYYLKTKNPVTGADIAGMVLGLVGDLVSLGMSIPGLVKSDSDKWIEMNSRLDAISSGLTSINRKMDAISSQIGVVPYKLQIIERMNELNFLHDKLSITFNALTKTVTADTDSVTKVEKFKKLVKDWGNYVYNATGSTGSKSIDKLTKDVVLYFGAMNFPKMYGEYITTVSFWEHDGYNLRKAVMDFDMTVSSLSALLTIVYLNDILTSEDPGSRKADIQALKYELKDNSDADSKERAIMTERDNAYRVLSSPRKTFERALKEYDFYYWLQTHKDADGVGFPRDGRTKSGKNCDQILKDLGLFDYIFLTREDARSIYEYYNRGKQGDDRVSFYRLLRDSVKFQNCPGDFIGADKDIIFTDKPGVFSHDNDDIALPTYKMFKWEVYRWHSNGDYFGISSAMNDKAQEEYHKILVRCDISSYSSGKINKLGTHRDLHWKTIVSPDRK